MPGLQSIFYLWVRGVVQPWWNDRGSLVTILKRCQAPLESPWSLDVWCHMSALQLGRIGTCSPGVHTSWSCLLPHVQQLLLALWLLFDSVTGKKCRHMWHPTPDTFSAPRKPWSSHQGASHLLNVTQKVLAKREFLQLWGQAGWYCSQCCDVTASPAKSTHYYYYYYYYHYYY